MDADPPVPPSSAPKKLKFTPKAPPRRRSGLVLSNNEATDAVGDAALLRKVNERFGTRKPKEEKKSLGNVAKSDQDGSSSSLTRTYSRPKDGNNKKTDSSNLKDSAEKSTVVSSSTAKKDGDFDEMLADDGSEYVSSEDELHEYKEPWDYESYYPTTLPWRKPFSGNPEILDKEEFGGEEKKEHNENFNSALELGLLENSEEPQMIFFQFPPNLPFDKQTGGIPVSTKGKEKVETSSLPKEDTPNRSSSLNELPSGHMGKMLVYRSGAIMLKLGDHLFQVQSGTDRNFPQDVAVMNTESKDCCIMGTVNKQAVVASDVNSLLKNLDLR